MIKKILNTNNYDIDANNDDSIYSTIMFIMVVTRIIMI